MGCVFLYTGQGKLHASTSHTLDYVVDQAEFTVENLQNFSYKLADAKKVSVAENFLPVDVQKKIDDIDAKLNTSSSQLASRTKKNSKEIRDWLDYVYVYEAVNPLVLSHNT